MQSQIILASTSRYRAHLLSQLGVSFSVFAAEIDETPRADERPISTCERLAIEKAKAATAAPVGQSALIIGSDQVLDYDGEAVSKPGSFEAAFAQLQRARGRTLVSYTALALLDMRSGVVRSDVVPTRVTYRDVTDAEIRSYLEREQPFDCAGSVKVEASGIALLSKVQSDDPSALIGLPLIRLTDFLRDAGYTFNLK